MTGAMIAAPGSGSSKTMITCGLLTLLKREGCNPAAFKCEPNYIDGLLHHRVSGVENGNLNSSFEIGTYMRQKPSRSMKGHFVVTGGVMKYFDGLGGASLQGSSFKIENIFRLPAILVVGRRGASLSLMALIQGSLEYDVTVDVKNEKKSHEKKTRKKEARSIRGIFFDRMPSMIYSRLKPMVEERFQTPAIGHLLELGFLQVGNRHLGLVLPDEIGGIRGQPEQLANQMDDNLEWESLLRIATDADGYDREAPIRPKAGMVSYFRLGVARGKAFCFYHEDNLETMEQAGVEPAYFSPFHQKGLPERLGGLTLGGGYPENHGEALAVNAAMWNSAATAVGLGMPVLAECGGCLYLLDRLEGADGTDYPMADVLKGHGYRAGKTNRSGHITLWSDHSFPLSQEGAEIGGHEFHYWNYGCGRDELRATAAKPDGGRYWSYMRTVRRVVAGLPHLYCPSCLGLAQSFTGQCMVYGEGYEPWHQRKQ